MQKEHISFLLTDKSVHIIYSRENIQRTTYIQHEGMLLKAFHSSNPKCFVRLTRKGSRNIHDVYIYIYYTHTFSSSKQQKKKKDDFFIFVNLPTTPTRMEVRI